MKRTITLTGHGTLLACVLFLISIALAALPCKATAQTTYESEGLSFTLNADDHTAAVGAVEGGTIASELTIPSTITVDGTEYTVTAIATRGFYNNQNISSVTIPSTVKEIGSQAFLFSTLTSVTLNDGLETIRDAAFSGTKLKEVTIPKTVTSIGNYAFKPTSEENKTLTTLKFEEGCNITSWGEYIFYEAPINTLYIPGSFITIPNFISNSDIQSSLQTLFLGEGIKEIGERAFWGTAITDITLPASLVTVGSSAFADCDSLKTVTFPENSMLTELAYDAFSDSPAITTVSLPGSLKKVPDNLFHSTLHQNLTSVTLGEGIEEIGANAFFGCGLTSIVLPSSLKTVGNKAFHSCKFTELTIPASVTSIGEGAFLLIENLSVTCLGSTPATVGTDMFYSSYLKNIRVPEDAVAAYKAADGWSTYKKNIQAIPPTSFTDAAGCTYALAMSADGNSLTATLTSCSNKQTESLEIPSMLYKDGSPYTWNDNYIRVASIADGALADCESLSLVLALNSTPTMGTGVFGSSLKAFVVNVTSENELNELKAADGWKEIADKLMPRFYVAEDNDKYFSQFAIESPNTATFMHIVFYDKSGDGEKFEYTVPDKTTPIEGITFTTTAIASEAFSGRTSITKLTIPNTVEKIGVYAFRDMYNLKELRLPDNLKYIGTNCFNSCYDLTVYYNGDPAQIIDRNGNPTENSDLSNYEYFPMLIVSSDKKAAFKDYNGNGNPWGYLAYIYTADDLKTLCLTDDSDITTAIATDGFYKAGDLSYKRTFNTPGQYATVCLPFAINPADYADKLDIYRLTTLGSESDETGFALRMDGTKIILSLEKTDSDDNSGDGDNTTIYPLKPLFVKAKEGVGEVTFKSVSSYTGEEILRDCEEPSFIDLDVYDWDGKSGIMSKANDLLLVAAGTVSKLGAGSHFLQYADVYTFNADGSFGRSDEVHAFRMFIATSKQSAQMSPLNISIGIEGETTGINGITDRLPSAAAADKTAPVYSLDGKMVSANGSTDGLKKGIYIKNKKKFVVK